MSVAIAPPRGNAAGLFVSTRQIARRVLLKFIRSPQLVVVGTVQGAMFLLIFRYVFGGAIALAGINYVDFVVPGFITTGVLFNAMTTPGTKGPAFEAFNPLTETDWVANFSGNNVQVFNPNGTIKVTITSPLFKMPWAMASSRASSSGVM